jgi:hypothetical protein
MNNDRLIPLFRWPLTGSFQNRTDELDALELWWSTPRLRQLLIYGRRRVGKSWLFRRFADGKPALILVVRAEAAEAQFASFADALEPVLGIRPRIDTASDVIRACYRAGRSQKILIVIDEFQNLLPTSDPEKTTQKDIQAVIEEEQDESDLRLVICGSAIRTMEGLLDEKSPLHGRFQSLYVPPMSFWEALPFLGSLQSVEEKLERYAICGGVPQYLTVLGAGALSDTLTTHAIQRFGSLHDEVRTVLSQELREPRVYFAILRLLAEGDKQSDHLTSVIKGAKATDLAPYLRNLTTLRLVRRRLPIGADPGSRGGSYSLLDYFVRFWFRFVFPYQEEIDAGLAPRGHYEAVVMPSLGDHVAPIFEDICRHWTRSHYADTAQRVGAWWGATARSVRKTNPERQSEEIDIVGVRGDTKTVTLLGECRWRSGPIDKKPLYDLQTFKIPSLEAGGFKIDRNCKMLFFSRSGFGNSISEEAAGNANVELVAISALEQLKQ